MPMARCTIIILLLMGFITSGIQAQNITKKKNGSAGINPNAKITPGVVIVKLKPEYRSLTNSLAGLKRNQTLAEPFQKFGVSKFEKTVSFAKPHTTPIYKRGKLIPDISLIHRIEFDPTKSIQEMINYLLASGLVEYAEPQYEDQMLYIPSDSMAQPGREQNLHLSRIRAFEAWGVEKGDTNVVIGVLDTGTELDHPDFVNRIKYNYADPIGGGDNDGDGFTDNFYGWDVGSNDNNPTWQAADHGVKVQGVCSAEPDNVAGTAGTGYNCKCLPIKISNSGGALTAGYNGIVYAATHGVSIINLSWGGYGGYSQANQDYITTAALLYDVLVVAAAGNTEGELDFYPASYDYVLSVTGLDTITSPLYDTLCDVRKTYPDFPPYGMSYSFKVDIASLEGSASTSPGGTWGPFGGSSFASPAISGAAALVRSKFPQLSALQVAEQLRVTGEILDTFDVTLPESRYKTGRKLNMYRAVTDSTSPAVRMEDFAASSKFGSDIFSGDTVTITNEFFNYLSPTSNLKITMKCINGYATMVDSVSILGVIDSLGSKDNLSDPFKIVINANAGIGQQIDLVMIMRDPAKNYYDYQGFKLVVNPSFLKLDTNMVKTTITSQGRIGYDVYETSSPSQGIGVNYSNASLLYEGGLMIGTSTTKVSDCVRGSFGSVDKEFKPVRTVHYIDPLGLKDMEAYTSFNDSLASSIIGIKVNQRSYAWKNSVDNKYFILEYMLINQSTATYDSIFTGIFADWDIGNYQYNRADWDDTRKVGYTYSTEGGNKVAGIAVLTDNAPSCYSLDNSAVGGTNINPNDGFMTSEKFNTLAKGVFRKQAGTSGFGNDVSQVISAKVTNFAPGDTAIVAFAVIATDNIFEMLDVAQRARNKFVSIKQGPVPTASNQTICRNETVDLTFTPTNGSKFAFFTTPPPSSPVATGTSYTMTGMSSADTLYIANADSLFYSNLKTVYIKKDNMNLEFYPAPPTDTILIASNTSLLLVNQSSGATTISWDLGDGNNATGNSVSHVYTTDGYYDIKIIGVSPLTCNDTLKRVLRVGNPTETTASLNGTNLKFYPNPVTNTLTVEFSNNLIPNDLSIELINALGSTVYYAPSGTRTLNLDLTGYPSGIYYIKFKSGENTLNKKIVKN